MPESFNFILLGMAEKNIFPKLMLSKMHTFHINDAEILCVKPVCSRMKLKDLTPSCCSLYYTVSWECFTSYFEEKGELLRIVELYY